MYGYMLEDNLQVWFSSSTMWIPGTILQLWGLVAGIFTCWVISPAFPLFFFFLLLETVVLTESIRVLA